MDPEQALWRLHRAGIVRARGGGWDTTPLWDRAFMRAQSRVVEFHEAAGDLRLPITYALVDVLGKDVPEADLRDLVETLLPIEVQAEQEMEPEAPEAVEAPGAPGAGP